MPYTIFENQLAFVKGRQITDAILMANEAVDLWKASETKRFVIKLDIEKAFDKISWSIINYMMCVKNYLFKWRKWIKACISNVVYSIPINGKPHGRIPAHRGIRQGDLISPFIFVLAMDYLSRLLSQLEKSNSIKGVNFNNNYSLTHILFAYDILLFVDNWDISIYHMSILYLGVPLGGNPKSTSFWEKVDIKINKKINN